MRRFISINPLGAHGLNLSQYTTLERIIQDYSLQRSKIIVLGALLTEILGRKFVLTEEGALISVIPRKRIPMRNSVTDNRLCFI